jgi:hypothetical protein
MMELGRIWKEAIIAQMEYFHDNCLKRLKQIEKKQFEALALN